MDLLLAARQSQSREGQTGIDTQDQDSRAWAEQNGHVVIAVVADKISGKVSPFDRPNLGPWLRDPAKIALYDGIVASKIDRYARARDWQMRQWAVEHGKRLFIVSPELSWPPEPGDTATPIIWDTLVNIAAAEWDNTSMRYRRMQKHLQETGYLVGGTSYGFRIVETGDHKTLEPDPVEAEYVRHAVALYLGGKSLRALCEWLDAKGAPTRRGGPWHPKSLRDIFRNPSLIGRRESDATGKTVLRHAPLLDMDTWRKLQAEMDRKAGRKGVSSATTAMLTNIAYCAKCFGPMYRHKVIGQPRKDGTKPVRWYYRCHGKDDRHPSTCRNMVPFEELEFMVDLHFTPESSDGQRAVKEKVTIPGRGHEDEIAEVERDIRELDLDDPGYLDKLAALRSERARLKALPATADQVIERETGQTVAEYWAGLDGPGKRAFLLASKAKVAAERDLAMIFIDVDDWVIPSGGAYRVAS
jgi:site-specific DNA recombinase